MGLVSPSQSSPGDTIEAADVNTPVNQLAAVINGNIEAANIADGLPFSKLESVAWASWTPSWTNFTTGNGTLNYAKYIQIGKTVHFRLEFTLGSTSAVSGGIKFSLPVNLHADYANDDDAFVSTVRIRDTGTAYFFGTLTWASSSTAEIRVLNAGSTYLGESSTSSTVPMTWTTNDIIQVSGTYEGV